MIPPLRLCGSARVVCFEGHALDRDLPDSVASPEGDHAEAEAEGLRAQLELRVQGRTAAVAAQAVLRPIEVQNPPVCLGQFIRMPRLIQLVRGPSMDAEVEEPLRLRCNREAVTGGVSSSEVPIAATDLLYFNRKWPL